MKRNYANVIVIGVLLLGIAGYFTWKYVSWNALLLSVGYYDDKVTVMNTADVHGHLMYNEENGEYFSLDETYLQMGLPLVKGLADEIRKENPNALFLDSGDFFQGTNEADIQKAQGMIEAGNAMGYDAMVVGNHDFDWDFDRTLEFRDQLKFPMLSANITKDGKTVFQPYMMLQAGDKKIGVFGLTTDQFLQDLQVYGDHGAVYGDPVEAAKATVAKLKEEKADAIILVSHLGDDMDRETIIPNVDGIDLVLSGHGHALYPHEQKVNGTFVAEAGSYTSHLGVADMYFRKGKVAKVVWHVKQSTDRSKEDPAVAQIAAKYHGLAMESSKEVIGTADEDLDGIRTHVRTKETNLANLVTDAMREAGQADITIFNGGGIRESVPKGDLTLYNVFKPLPFFNSLVTVELKGAVVYEAIEHGLETWPNGSHNGGFPQVSGMSYVIDGSKPAGKRLVSITKDGAPLDRDKVYKVAITDYLLAGGDDYKMFKDAKVLSRGDLLKDMLVDYIRNKKVIAPKLEGRITVINQRYK